MFSQGSPTTHHLSQLHNNLIPDSTQGSVDGDTLNYCSSYTSDNWYSDTGPGDNWYSDTGPGDNYSSVVRRHVMRMRFGKA